MYAGQRIDSDLLKVLYSNGIRVNFMWDIVSSMRIYLHLLGDFNIDPHVALGLSEDVM